MKFLKNLFNKVQKICKKYPYICAFLAVMAVYCFFGGIEHFSGSTGLKQQKFKGQKDNIEWHNSAPKDGGESVVTKIDIPHNTGDHYSYRWWGYFNPTEAGKYYFKTASDDYSHVQVAGKHIVNNGGYHGRRAKEGSIDLEAGSHAVNIVFGEAGGGDNMTFWWKGPGQNDWTLELAAKFTPEKPAEPEPEPEPVPEVTEEPATNDTATTDATTDAATTDAPPAESGGFCTIL